MNALEHLLKNPKRYQLGPAIRMLGMASQTNAPLAGGAWEHATVRIRQHLAPSIALHEVMDVRRSGEQSFELVTPVLNMAGVTGAIPKSVWQKLERRDLLSLDRITHQLVADWYRSWETQENDDSPFHCSFARSRSAAGLEAMLEFDLKLPVHVNESFGGWTTGTNESGLCRIAYDPSSTCQLTVGPVDRNTFDRLMPGGQLLRQLCDRARSYGGPEVSFQVQVILKKQDVRTASYDFSRFDRGFVIGEPKSDLIVQLRDYELEVQSHE